MKREIKYRAWCEGKHEGLTFSKPHMDYEVTLSQKGNWCLVESGWDIQGEYPTIPIMQFAGFEDNKQNPIYEGDILSDWTETDEGKIQSFCQVFWNEFTGSWHLDNSYKQDKSSSVELWMELDDCEYEITGNIYANPELINPKTI